VISNGEKGIGALGVFLSPLSIWALHFLATYVTAAVYCARARDPDAAADPVRSIVLVLTITALAAIVFVLRLGYRRFGNRRAPGSAASGPVEPKPSQFFRTVLLWTSLLSAVAIVCVAAVTLLFGDCR
jgi:hypothetical protein